MLQVLKNGIYFTLDGSTWAFRCVVESRDLRSLSSDFEQVQSEYNKAQERLLSAIVEVARSYVPLFHLFASLVAQLDVLLAFAEAAAVAPIPYVRPEMLEGSGERCGRWERVGCRYPCGGGTPCAAGSADGTAVYPERCGAGLWEERMRWIIGEEGGCDGRWGTFEADVMINRRITQSLRLNTQSPL